MIYFKALDAPYEWQWVKSRTHAIWCEDTQGIVAHDENMDIKGVALMDNWTPESVSLHLALDGISALRRGLLVEVAIHVFYTAGRKRLFGLVPSNNERALKFNRHIGWREVARVPDAIGEGIDYIVMRMDKEDCRWLPKELRVAA